MVAGWRQGLSVGSGVACQGSSVLEPRLVVDSTDLVRIVVYDLLRLVVDCTALLHMEDYDLPRLVVGCTAQVQMVG